MEKIRIDFITDKKLKSKIVNEVLNDLPEWFGIEEALLNYVNEAEQLPLWAAITEGEVIGFIDLKATSEDTAEISCMGIKRQHHRQGIGKILFSSLENYAKENYSYLQVKTVNEGTTPGYDKTIQYYLSCGFSKLEVFPTLWDERNPCLILVKKIGG
ncbi:GNAT family N-acetyltransferase [Enterococcus sp. HY326]|uniref:GNAT family N-acetyltransferase n=1 Tax=Enterococcus sp. HY326 TaxID=2971265 RepID=UPI00223EED13|nr:GNAT family N-acetyltransferase [Enterococcus sp. HY326]